MFKAIIQADAFTSALDSVSVLVDECKIRLEDDGMNIRAVDPANVGMVDMHLDGEAFESFDADGGVVGVNLGRLEDFVGMADSGQLIELELDEETRKLNITIGGLDGTLALIDPESIRDEPDIPDLDLPATIVTEGKDIDRAVKAADMVSDHIALGVYEEEEIFYVEAEGDTDDVRLELTQEELISLTPGEARSLFSLDYLKDMNKAIPKKAEVEIELGEEFPMKMHFYADPNDGGVGIGDTTYMLAPRIQSD